MEFYSLIIFTLFVGFVNASASITLLIWMRPRMILGGWRFWLAKNLLPESEAKDKIFSDIEFAKQPEPFIQVYNETAKIGYLTGENWEILKNLGLGKESYFKDKFGVLTADISRYLTDRIFSFELFQLVWGVCPKQDFEGQNKAIEAAQNRLKQLAEDTTFWYKPLGGCLHCFHVWLMPFTYSICALFYIQSFPLNLWQIAVFFGGLFISGCLVNLFDKD